MRFNPPGQRSLRIASAAFCLWAMASLGASVFAATINGSFASVSDTDFDLTAIGTADWAYWNTESNPATGGAKTNEKSGASMIGTMDPIGGDDVRGSNSGTRPYYDFSFSDGVSPASDTVDNVIGLFNTQLDGVGTGVGLTVMLPTTDTYEVTVWGAVFNGRGRFTASLPGATDFVHTTFSGAAPPGAKESGQFTLLVTPDNANDPLGLNFVLAEDTGNVAHVVISGVAASVVPEPSTVALAGFGVLGLFGFGRRRKR
jgi:hypothetical protein